MAINVMNGLYEGRVSMAWWQRAEAVGRGNISMNILPVSLSPRFLSTPVLLFFSFFFYPSLCLSFLPSRPLFSSSASCDWSLTQTLSAPWIHSSSISSLLPIKQSSYNDTHNGHTWQSGAGGRVSPILVAKAKPLEWSQWVHLVGVKNECCAKRLSIFVRCFISKKSLCSVRLVMIK